MISNKINDKDMVQYSDDALANIIGIAVTSVPGVVGMAAKNKADNLWQALQKENYSKGIKVIAENNRLDIEISIIVAYGTKFSEVASNITKKVHHDIKSLTDLTVNKVVVAIQGVRVTE